jgi:hypothetical protein
MEHNKNETVEYQLNLTLIIKKDPTIGRILKRGENQIGKVVCPSYINYLNL